jgi:2-phospho-L-lactate/phosphoenolpyruvate guanylyltransferase
MVALQGMPCIRAFVPLKHPAVARVRLLEALTAKQRHSMYFTLARRIIVALRNVPLVHDTVIVTSSAEVEMFAGHLGIRVIHQVRDAGINSACEAAIASSSALGMTNALIVAGDLPLVTSESITALLEAAHLDERGITIVPDRRHTGTNALVCTPPDAIRLRFGPNSFAEHLRTAQEHGLETRIFECGELALDIDDPEDLDAWRGYDSRNESYTVGERRESTSTAGGPGGIPGHRVDEFNRAG